MQTMTRRRFILAAAAGAAVTTLDAGNLRNALAAQKIKLGEQDALLVIDVQNCFAPGGSLAVSHGDEIVPVINRMVGYFRCVVMTQDWHPAGHVSFASAHSKKPFSTIDMPYGKQVMWPDHCVQGMQDANLLKDLDVTKANMILRKGFNPKVDGYSAFFDNDHKTSTGLEGYFKARGVKRVFLAGLATDFCVMWSALDARKIGFEAAVIEDACRGIDLDGSLKAAWDSMLKAGVSRIQTSDLMAT
jgi:nicotinamidase/pyrazinamidase